jgi:hypothetical protein
MTKTKLIVLIAILVVLVYGFFAFDVPYRKTIDDFATCAAAGRPIMESFPRQCNDGKGNTYTEETGVGTSTADKIFVAIPQPGAKISSPVKMSGQARGTWFFEAAFPVKVISTDGTVLGQGHATAKASDGSWMTTGFVPWTATVTFDRGVSLSGSVRLEKDNPSGDVSRDEYMDIPVVFSTSTIIR